MLPCRRCGDFGILRVKAVGEPQEALVYCTCNWSELMSQIWKLPKVNRKIEQAFEVEKCPLIWFLPDNERSSVPRGNLMPTVAAVAQRWRERVRAAEKFWREYGPLFDERPHFWNEPGDGKEGA